MPTKFPTTYDELAALVKNRPCTVCETQVRIIWLGGVTGEKKYGLRCECYPEPPSLGTVDNYKKTIARRRGKMQSHELVKQDSEIQMANQVEEVMSLAEVKRRRNLVTAAVQEMEKDIDYGDPAGKGQLALYEAGAENLRAMFNISWRPVAIEEFEDWDNFEFRYKYRAEALDANGNSYAAWVAMAWSKEKKFNGMDRADLANNVQDRAIKRAFVNLIKNVTGSSAIFKRAQVDHADVDPQPVATARVKAEVKNGSHSWFDICPIHSEEFFKKGKMPVWAHKSGSAWCNQPSAIASAARDSIDEASKVLEWTPDQVKKWVLDNYKKEWPKLTSNDHISAMEAINALVSQKLSADGGEETSTGGS